MVVLTLFDTRDEPPCARRIQSGFPPEVLPPQRDREDCCGERERTLTALISSDGRTWQPVHDNAGKDFQVLSIQVNGRKARYIRLQLRATDYLNLLGVSVFPYEPE